MNMMGKVIFYEDRNFQGRSYECMSDCSDMSSYMSMWGWRDCIRSCRMIPMHRGQFRMRIYERENFGGMMHEMMDDCDNIMDRYQMSNCMSCNVMDGQFRMRIYERENFGGMMH